VIVDCDSCVMREIACSDCFVTVLLDAPAGRPVDLDDDAAEALEVLADAALVPPLRLATAVLAPVPVEADESDTSRHAV
jgi:hypothetical protein